MLLLQLWISLFQLLTAGKAEGWGETDKRHLSACGMPGPRLWFLSTTWPNQHSHPQGELVSIHVLLRCLHDVAKLVYGWGGGCICVNIWVFTNMEARKRRGITQDCVGTQNKTSTVDFFFLNYISCNNLL